MIAVFPLRHEKSDSAFEASEERNALGYSLFLLLISRYEYDAVDINAAILNRTKILDGYALI
jgi:hypothetical protein